MKKTGLYFGLVLLLLTAIWSSASGQSGARNDTEEYYNKIGSLSVWTTDEVHRSRLGHLPKLLGVRFGQHPGFDRVVFDLTDKPAGYLVNYNEPPFQGQASERIVRVRGKAFVEISLYPVTSSEEEVAAFEKLVPVQSRAKTALIADMKTFEWFEAELGYAVGLKRKTPFRVLELSNPARLVVDFKR